MPTRPGAGPTWPRPVADSSDRPLRQRRVVGGRYFLGEPVGHGSSAVVYRAWDRTLHRIVAVKVFQVGHDPVEERRAALEAATLARLDHPGLVLLLDGGCDDGDRFVVLELVEGQSLGERLSRGPLSAQVAAGLVAGVAGTLAYVHGRGVVHRDVKPANVLVDGAGRPRLGDFGVARSAGEPEALAETGYIVGTPRYMAPEQVRGEFLTGAVDVYALGLTLLECLTGAPEYSGHGLECAVARLYRQPVVPRWVPPGLARLVGAMTDGDPRRRPSAAEVAVRLRSGAGQAVRLRWAVEAAVVRPWLAVWALADVAVGHARYPGTPDRRADVDWVPAALC